MKIVNGYPCYDCADIAKAKRGEDPRLKEADLAPPGSAERLEQTLPSHLGRLIDVRA